MLFRHGLGIASGRRGHRRPALVRIARGREHARRAARGRRAPPTRRIPTPMHRLGELRLKPAANAGAEGRVLRDGSNLYWWVEILAILAFYVVYSAIRNANGSHPSTRSTTRGTSSRSSTTSASSTRRRFRRWALHFKPLIITANYLYGSLHFIVTIWVAVWLFRKYSDDYPRYRNTLAVTTALALIGFTIFPLMPPRLLAHYRVHLTGFIDTLDKYPTPWSFDSGRPRSRSRISSRPCRACTSRGPPGALAMVPRMKTRARKILAGSYPFVTLAGDRHHRQPLRHRRGRRPRDPRDRLGARQPAHPRRSGETAGAVNYDP